MIEIGGDEEKEGVSVYALGLGSPRTKIFSEWVRDSVVILWAKRKDA